MRVDADWWYKMAEDICWIAEMWTEEAEMLQVFSVLEDMKD